MHSPCLRLELLQYILGLDNRYSGTNALPLCACITIKLIHPSFLSVAHVKRSVELAATCLNISESDVFHHEGEDISTNSKLLV